MTNTCAKSIDANYNRSVALVINIGAPLLATGRCLEIYMSQSFIQG